MSYKVFLILPGDKKIWINRSFKTKAEAEKELKSAKKELASAVRIMDSGIVSDAVPKTKPAPKPAPKKTVKSPSESVGKLPVASIPTKGLMVLKFVQGKTNHLVGITPTDFALVKQAFNSVKCNQASVSLTPTRMTITAIDKDHISVIRLTVPVRTGSGLNCYIDPSDLTKNILGNSIYCLDDYTISNLDKIFRDFSLTQSAKATVKAKDIKDMLAPYSSGKNGQFYRIKVEIGKTNRATTTDEDFVPISTAVPLKKLAGLNKDLTSYYKTGYIHNAVKLFGSSIVVLGMKGNNYPIAISGVNKGVKIQYICAPVVTE